jgi:hypothetical protein
MHNLVAGWQAEEWSAAGTWATAVIALLAGAIALRQVSEARRLREEQAQPYVVAFMEPSSAGREFIDFVVRNFGATAAYDVQIDVSPQMQRTGTNGRASEDVWLPKIIPILVPGQEWRSYWDAGHQMFASELPKSHNVVVTYKDSRGRQLSCRSSLDWNAYRGSFLAIYGPHHIAKALREIQKHVAKWGESGRGLSVYARDGDAKDARSRERLEEQYRRLKEWEAAQAAQPASETDDSM